MLKTVQEVVQTQLLQSTTKYRGFNEIQYLINQWIEQWSRNSLLLKTVQKVVQTLITGLMHSDTSKFAEYNKISWSPTRFNKYEIHFNNTITIMRVFVSEYDSSPALLRIN